MGSVEFHDNRLVVKDAIQSGSVAFLDEVASEFVSQVTRNSSVDQGQTKGSWRYEVDEDKLEAVVGSELENAIWEEFGTGEYALEKNGRMTPWYVPVEGFTGKKKPTFNGKVVIVHGKDGRAYYKTNGKKPRRMLHRAYDNIRPKAQAVLDAKLKEAGL